MRSSESLWGTGLTAVLPSALAALMLSSSSGTANAQSSPPICPASPPGGCNTSGLDAEDAGRFPRAAELYDAGCNLGDPNACRNRDELAAARDPRVPHTDGPNFGVSDDRSKIASECAEGHSQACIVLAHKTEADSPERVNTARTFSLYGRACTGGDQAGCDALREMLVLDGPPSFARASVASGYGFDSADRCVANPEPCAAEKRERGLKLAGSKPRPAAWLFLQACAGQDGAACFELADVATMAGYQVTEERLLALMKEACHLGDTRGCAAVSRRQMAAAPVTESPSSTYGSAGLAIGVPVYRARTTFGAELTVIAYPFWKPYGSGNPLGVGAFFRPTLDTDGRAHWAGGGQLNLGPIGTEVGYSYVARGDTGPAEKAVLVGPFFSLGIVSTSVVWGIGTSGTPSSVVLSTAIKVPFGIGENSAADFIPSLH